MKVKTSVTLSAATLQAIDEFAGPGTTRSGIIEQAVMEFVQRLHRQLREQKDLEILNRCAEQLNREVENILAFQVEI